MKYELKHKGKSPNTNLNYKCVITHGDKELHWDVIKYHRTALFKNDNVFYHGFDHINMYIASLSDQAQDKIFEAYQKMQDTIDSIFDVVELTTELSVLVKQLYENLDFFAIDEFMLLQEDVVFPGGLQEEYTGGPFSKDGTYLKSDYEQLISLMVFLRPLIPIWGFFIKDVEKSVGGEYKEYQAMHLLLETDILTLPPIRRLERYLNTRMSIGVDNTAGVINGISADDLPDYLLAKILVRRIVVGDVSFSPESGHIVSSIYGFITSEIKNNDKNFGAIKGKLPASDLGSIEDEISNLERYKIKSDVPIGNIEKCNAYMSNTISVVKNLDPTIPKDIVLACVENVLNIDVDYKPFQIQLCQWILSRQVAPQAIMSMSPEAVMSAIGICQAALWHWGFEHIAILLTSKLEEGPLLSQDSITRITAKQLELLGKVYPHHVNDGPARKSNPAYLAISAMTKEMLNRLWSTNAPEFMTELLQELAMDEQMSVAAPNDIANQLADLVLHLNNQGVNM